MLHRLMHLLGWNTGRVVTKLDEDRNVWVGFQCDKCGEISGRHKIKR